MTDDTRAGSHPVRCSWEQLLADESQRGRSSLLDVYRHAAATYPSECCGFIRASGEVHRAVNYQDILHADDPVTWPRTGRRAYSLAPQDTYLLVQSFLSSDPAIAVYHSHPDVGAYFSDKDAAGALYEGRPVYDLDYLVIDVRHARPNGAKLFRFLDGRYTCVWSETISSW